MVDEYGQEYRLWQECFGDTDEYIDYYFQEKTKDNIILKMFKEDELVSMVHLNPYDICWEGKLKRLYYIVGVCTAAQHRKHGYMRTLLNEAFKRMKDEDCPFTYLMPAKKEIYEPFDFQFIYTQKRLKGRLEAAELVAAEQPKAEFAAVSYQSLTGEKRELVAEFQNQFLEKNYDLYAYRSKEYLDRLSKEMVAAGGELLIVLDKKENICGTLAYMAELREKESICEVVESIFSPEKTKAMAALLEKRLLERGRYWQVNFLETSFWQVEELENCLEDASFYEKPIIMAKTLVENEASETLLKRLKAARVYLNEIV